MKKVSIIIPTRNRANLLRFALESAINQTYGDLEIVVCDNYSEDNTREIVDSFFPNDKILYVKTDQAFSMPDNWEFALNKSSGEYVTILTDDSYLLPNAIEKIISEMDFYRQSIAVWKHCAYFSKDWAEEARRNIVYIPNVTNKTYVMSSARTLKTLFAMEENAYIISPRSLNSLCHRSVIERAISIQGRFFLPTCPDFTSAAGVLLNSQSYLFIDKPLFLDSVTNASIGASGSFNLGESAQNAIKEYKGDLNDIMFLGIPVSPGSIAKSLETIRKFYPAVCPEINMKNLLCAIADRLSKLDANGVETSLYWDRLQKYLSNQPIKIRFSILKRKLLSKLKWALIRIMRSYPRLESFERLRNVQILKGENLGFDNIAEAANILIPILNCKK